MKKQERDPDLSFPDEDAIEERVKRLMDINVPSNPPANMKPAKAVVKNNQPIRVDSESKLPPAIKVPSTSTSITVTDYAEDTTVLSAPPLPFSGAVGPKTSQAAPSKAVIPTGSSKKSIIITHFAEEEPNETAGVQPELPKEPVIDLTPVANPLIPTDKLSSTIAPRPPKKQSKKTTKPKNKKAAASPVAAVEKNTLPKPSTPSIVQESVIAPITVKETSDSEPNPMEPPNVEDSLTAAEIAAAFDDNEEDLENTEASVPSLETAPIAPNAPDTQDRDIPEPIPTAPPLPGGIATKEPLVALDDDSPKEVEEPKPKFDKFKPLTNIRPQRPDTEKIPAPLNLDEVATNRAVDDIIVENTNSADGSSKSKLPEVKTSKLQTARPKKLTNKRTSLVKTLFVAIAVAIVAGGAALLALPTTRYKALNATGIMGSADIIVRDQSTGQPLKNATVIIGSASQLTDATGTAHFAKTKLGESLLKIEKNAFTAHDQAIKISWGKKTSALVQLMPSGTQYDFVVTDYATGRPVDKAEITAGQANAISDSSGRVKITVGKNETESFSVAFAANGYRKELVTIDPTQARKVVTLKLVLAGKHAYIAKRSGTYDIYAADIDGKNETLVLKGSGNETADNVLVSNPFNNAVALVSTRSSKKNNAGKPLNSLSVADVVSKQNQSVVEAEKITVIGWSTDRLVYVQTLTDTKPADVSRQLLMSYNLKSRQAEQLASANYFNYVSLVGNRVYYAPASAYQSAANIGFFSVSADGSAKQTILEKETWNVYRNSHDHLSLSVQQDWYDYKLGDKQAVKQSSAPEMLGNRVYVDSPDGQRSIWVNGDGIKASLKMFERSTQKDVDILGENGLQYPISWLNNNTVIYRINASKETADFVFSLDGGKPQKIQDVSNSSGVDRWKL